MQEKLKRKRSASVKKSIFKIMKTVPWGMFCKRRLLFDPDVAASKSELPAGTALLRSQDKVIYAPVPK